MKRFYQIVLVIGLVVLGFTFSPSARAELPTCTADVTTGTKITAALYAKDPCGGGTSATSPVPKGCAFNLNITVKNETANCALGSGTTTFDISSNLTYLSGRGGNRVFNPWFNSTADGPASINVTWTGGNTMTTAVTFAVGTGTGPNPSSSSIPGDPAEDTKICSYKDSKGAVICVGNRGELDCNAITECKPNKCTRIEADTCPSGLSASATLIPGPNTPPSDLGALIEWVFNTSLRVVGIAVFVMAVYGGFLMVLAGGMPQMHAKGREAMTNAFLGALLLLAAYVILNTINPDFVREKGSLPPLPTPSGARSSPTPASSPSPSPSSSPAQ